MAKKANKDNKAANSTIALNKKARHDYFIEERFEAGLVLQGWEVKSLRAGKVNLTDSYVFIKEGEAFISGMQISPLLTVSTHFVPESTRVRKLLLKRNELAKLIGAVERKGYTLVALALYWKKGYAKLEIALAKGKAAHDKRATLKERDWQREKQRVLKHG